MDDAESQEAKKETEEIAKNNDDLVKDIKEVLGDKVAEVKISSRLKSGAVCLVADAMGPSLSMEHTFAAMDNPMFKAKRISEINPKHDLFSKLQILHANGKDDVTANYTLAPYNGTLTVTKRPVTDRKSVV